MLKKETVKVNRSPTVSTNTNLVENYTSTVVTLDSVRKKVARETKERQKNLSARCSGFFSGGRWLGIVCIAS